MVPKIELLAPGGDIDSIKAAIAAGADAIYCGLERFNARNRAENISYEQLQGILHLAHKNDCQVFLTLNIIIVEPEIATLTTLLNKLSNSSIDGIILQDIGMLYLLQKYFKSLPVHGSTQLTTHNRGQIDFLSSLGVTRVNLSRELNLQEITLLTEKAHQTNIMTEVFVHGSNCLSFSGLCYISSVLDGKSGNRGRCSQPCRSEYQTTQMGNNFPFNLKDNSAFNDLESLAEAEVDSLKIEGRIKKFHYVYTVVASYRQQLQNYYNRQELSKGSTGLYKVFNRDFTNGFLADDIHKGMFIDNPRDNSALHLAGTFTGNIEENLEQAKRQLYDEKTDIIVHVQDTIKHLSIDKVPLTIVLSGTMDRTLQINITTGDTSYDIESHVPLRTGLPGNNSITHHNMEKLFRSLNDSEYQLENIILNDLQPELQLPFKELTRIKRNIFKLLHNSKEFVAPVTLPRLKQNRSQKQQPSLSVLIASPEDTYLLDSQAEVYFELPGCFDKNISKYVDLFEENDKLIPWFPAVMIGEHFENAIKLLQRLNPQSIVTNNSGIAHEASKLGINWIAGPHLNIANSYSLLCLKEEFHCAGAFISNELNNYQIKTIKKPENFSLHYSIYHPIIMMTSRQCLFHQVTGCEKDSVDDQCLSHCQKKSTIRTLQGTSIIVDKQSGHYHTVYNNHNFLNTAIITDTKDIFDNYFIDLRNIETETNSPRDKRETVQYFEDCLKGKDPEGDKVRQRIYPTTDKQYIKGI
ncbi:peptidase U32 family protein [Desulforhopalus sp. 52FAK]